MIQFILDDLPDSACSNSPLALLAAENDHSIVDWLFPYGPLFVFALISLLMIYRLLKQAEPSMTRYEEHQHRIAVELKRIADALENKGRQPEIITGRCGWGVAGGGVLGLEFG